MPGEGKSLIRVVDLSFAYPGSNRPVLNRINAALYRGEFVSVIGPNGSGKTTLIKLMAGLLLPVNGRVIVNGLDTGELACRQQIRRRVGLVLQNPDNQLVASIVEEDIAFGPENLNLSPEEVHQRVNEALETVGLSHLRKRSTHFLSGGEKQLLAIAGVLALRPACLVLDEPTSMLDPISRQQVIQVLRNLAFEGTAVVMVTHHMDEAVYTDRVWVMCNSELVANGDPSMVFRHPKLLQDMGLGLSSTAELTSILKDQGMELPPDIITVEDMVDYLCRVLK